MSFFTSGIIPPGVVLPYAGSAAPNGWLLCYGQTISRSTYSGLFAAIGTTYGNGDGSTTFNLPDLRGRTPFGKDNMGGVAANRITNAVSGITGTTLGAAGGSEIMHQHNHSATGLTVSGTNSTSSVSGSTVANTSGLMGSNQTHGHDIRNSGGGDNNLMWHRLMDNQYSASGDGTWDCTSYGATGALSTNIDHTHSIPSLSLSGTANAQSWSGSVAGSTSNTGTGGAQNMPPAIILNQIIKV